MRRKKRAAVYSRPDDLIIEQIDMTDIRHPVASDEPLVFLPVDASDEALGRAVLEVVGRAKEGVPHPDEATRRRWSTAFCRQVKARSWGKFTIGVVEVDVWVDDGAIVVSPSVNLGPRHGFADIDGVEPLRSSDHPSAEEVGRLVREGLALSRPEPRR